MPFFHRKETAGRWAGLNDLAGLWIGWLRCVEEVNGVAIELAVGPDPEVLFYDESGRGGWMFWVRQEAVIAERQWHPSQEFRKRPDGRVEMRLETTGRKELVRWVLSWMPDVKVLAPKSLRDRIAEKLRDGLRAQQ
jgi:hypothetical protein